MPPGKYICRSGSNDTIRRFGHREKRLNKEKQEHEIEQISATDKEQIKKEIEAAVERVKEKRKSGEMPSQDENGNTND